jgi:ATP-dependent Clp protease adaptor protein ClpS
MIKELTRTEIRSTTGEDARIVLINDEHNTFDWVIKSLVEVCDHTAEQAEQCAIIVHHKGSYPVKTGNRKDREPRCAALCERGLTAEMDSLQ